MTAWPIATLPQEFTSAMAPKADKSERMRMTHCSFFARGSPFACPNEKKLDARERTSSDQAQRYQRHRIQDG